MIGEGIAAARTIIVGAIVWAGAIGAAAAFVGCVAAFCVGPLSAPAVKGARRRLDGPSWRRGRVRARFLARRRLRRPHGYDRAA